MFTLLAACEGAVELNAGKRLAPDTPVADAGLRDLAQAHSEAECAEGAVRATTDPDATYGAGSIELVDREPLDPALDPPEDDHVATSAIWQRFRTDERLDSASWDLMAAGQSRCSDGYLYMTLVLQDDGGPEGASVRRVTAGNGPTFLGGVSADGATVAIRSEATDLDPGSDTADIWLYDVDDDALTPTGVEPGTYPDGAVLTSDGSTVLYDEEVQDDEIGTAYVIRSFDVATGTTSSRVGPDFHTVSVTSVSADGSVAIYEDLGAGGAGLWASFTGTLPDQYIGDISSFAYDTSVSDDGRFVSLAGLGARIVELSTSEVTVVGDGDQCRSYNSPRGGTALTADGSSLAYSCEDTNPAGYEQDLFVWDRAQGSSRRLTSDEDDRGTVGAPSISDDGRFVAFVYERPDLPSGVATYVWDRTTDRSTLVAPFGSEAAISGDGGTLAFTGVAPGQTDASLTDLYVWANPAV